MVLDRDRLDTRHNPDEEDKRKVISITIGVEVYAETEGEAWEITRKVLYSESSIEGCFLIDEH